MTQPKFSTETSARAPSALKSLFLDGISDLYWAENHLVKSLPKMISAATATSLISTIESHLNQTKGHIARLEKVFGYLERKRLQKMCAMEGLTKEAEGIVEGTVCKFQNANERALFLH